MARKYVRKAKVKIVEAVQAVVAAVLPKRRHEMYRDGRTSRQTLCFNVR